MISLDGIQSFFLDEYWSLEHVELFGFLSERTCEGCFLSFLASAFPCVMMIIKSDLFLYDNENNILEENSVSVCEVFIARLVELNAKMSRSVYRETSKVHNMGLHLRIGVGFLTN